MQCRGCFLSVGSFAVQLRDRDPKGRLFPQRRGRRGGVGPTGHRELAGVHSGLAGAACQRTKKRPAPPKRQIGVPHKKGQKGSLVTSQELFLNFYTRLFTTE